MYKVISSEIEVEGENYITYGIYGETASVADISTDRERVEKLAELCNRLDLSEIHLIDVAEDFVGCDIEDY